MHPRIPSPHTHTHPLKDTSVYREYIIDRLHEMVIEKLHKLAIDTV